MKIITTILFFSLTLISLNKIEAQTIGESNISKTKEMKNSTKYGLHGKLVAQESKGKDLVKILLEASALMKTAKGCHLYVIGVNQDNPDEIWITEIWESKADHDNSLNVPGVKELIGKAIPILSGSPEKGQEWNILGGTGIE